ncbi:unnamed protein product [Echinostoma caproni]|uniref:FHA domain-containing protein n=1 Tax=Echinostoma caproni TaxID=27848 RepID=A0A183ASG0_9TREM|nr:unnamed protein product [Echinostoma caproni]
MSTQFTGTRKSRPFGLYKTHYLPNLHRVGGSYFRSRSKRKSHVGRRSARAPVATVKKEPKNITWLPGDDYLLIHSVLLRQSVFAKLLNDHPTVFFAGRDELDLFRQWSRFQSCHMIKEGNLPPMPQVSTDNVSVTGSRSQAADLRLIGAKHDDSVIASGLNNDDTVLGGDPESFSDTELLLEETTASALSAGLDKLTEPSTAARRHRLLGQSSYHGFQSLVTESVISALVREKQQQQQQQSHQLIDSNRDDSSRGWYPSHAGRPTPGAILAGLERSNPGPSNRLIASTGTSSPSTINSEFDFRRRLELYRFRKRLFARLRRTAEEAKRWTRLVEIRAASGLELTDPQPIYPVLAALTGTRTRFLLKEKEVTFGRSSLVYQPHIDLSREGDSTRVSRCHGRIRLATSGTFWLANFSKHPVFVDGNPVLTGFNAWLSQMREMWLDEEPNSYDISVSGLGSYKNEMKNLRSLDDE